MLQALCLVRLPIVACVLLCGVVPTRGSQDDHTGITAIVWSAGRHLLWSDFRGKPDERSGLAAMTAYELSYDGDCDAGPYRFRVVSTFMTEASWVRPVTNRISLQHEQTHFDLSEVSARRMRKALGELVNPCEMTVAQRQAVVARQAANDRQTQIRYDRETDNGSDFSRQRSWDQDVARQLAALSRYTERNRGPAVRSLSPRARRSDSPSTRVAPGSR
jgi:hypothetical protein